MYHIKNDQRSIRSAENIYMALTRLMDSTPFEAIKISELVEQADIGRATFYRNFDALEDVLHWRCDETVNELFVYLVEYRRTNVLTLPHPFLKPLLRYFYLHSDIVELLIQANRVDMLQGAIQERFLRVAALIEPLASFPDEYLGYGTAIQAASIVSILVEWVKLGKRHAPDELADNISNLVRQYSAIKDAV